VEETGRRIVDGYFAAQPDSASVLTMACYDLNQVQHVCDALDSLFAKHSVVSAENYALYATARHDARGYGRSYGAAGDYDLVDLRGLLADGVYAGDSAGALQAIDSMILYARSNAEGSGGISIFYPYYEPTNFTADWGNSYAGYSVSGAYLRHLTAFANIQTGETLTDWSGLQIMADDQQEYFSLQLTSAQANHVVKAELLLLKQEQWVSSRPYHLVWRQDAGLPDENGLLTVRAQKKTMVSADGKRYLPYRLTDDGKYRVALNVFGDYSVYGQLEMELSEDNHFAVTDYLVKDPETGTLTNRHGIDLTNQDIWSSSWKLYVPILNSEGILLGYDQWTDLSGVRQGKEWSDYTFLPFTAEEIKDDGSFLYAVWQLTDVQGNTWCSDLILLDSTKHWSAQGIDLHTTDSALQLSDVKIDAIEGDEFYLYIDLTNISERQIRVNLCDGAITLGGQSIYTNDFYSDCILDPGETVTKIIQWSFT